jgi:signal transduction histidine kinase
VPPPLADPAATPPAAGGPWECFAGSGDGARLADALREPLLLLDAGLRVLGANRAFRAAFGGTEDSMAGWPLARIEGGAWDVPALRALAEDVLRWGAAFTDVEIAQTVAGRRRVLAVNACECVVAGARAVLLAIGDVTAGAEGEAARAAEVEARRRAQFALLPIPTYVWRAVGDDFVLVDYNDAVATLTRGLVAHVVGEPVSAIWPDQPQLLEDMRRCLAERAPVRRDIELVMRSTGERRSFSLTLGALGPDRVLAHAEDTTERRRLEEQLRQVQKMDAVGRLAGGVAHDFNNLLTVITSYSELALLGMGDDDPHRGDVVAIRDAAFRAASLTRQLLTFSRRQVVRPAALDLNAVVDGIAPMLRRLIGAEVEIVRKAARPLGRVSADRGQVEQVLINLAVNARDAMPGGGTLTLTTADVELDEQYAALHPPASAGAHVMLAVSDTGHGMDETVRARVFEPFFTTKEVGQGTGLGLSTVYGIVRQSGGHIAIYSEPGHGTTVKVYLPRVTAAEAAPAELPAAAPALVGGAETVLLVEDDEAVRELARGVLARSGYAVVEARDGRDAVRVAGEALGRVDLLVTDVVMPGLGGRALFAELAARRPGLRVLYMSGYTDDDVLRRGLLDPGMAFLEKPFTATGLARAVRAVLDGPPPAGAA